MNAVVLCALLGLFAFGIGLVAALLTRRYGVTLTVGLLVVAMLYLLYVLTTGEGAPFVSYVMAAGAVGSAALLAGLVLGVGVARRLDRQATLR